MCVHQLSLAYEQGPAAGPPWFPWAATPSFRELPPKTRCLETKFEIDQVAEAKCSKAEFAKATWAKANVAKATFTKVKCVQSKSC